MYHSCEMRRTAPEWQRRLAAEFIAARGKRSLKDIAAAVAAIRPDPRRNDGIPGTQTLSRLENAENVTVDVIDAVANALGMQLEVKLIGNPGKTSTVPTQPTDTSDAALARARRTSDHGTEVGRVSDQHLSDLEKAYEYFARRLDDKAREELAHEMELAGERYIKRMQEKETKKASGEY